MKPITLQIDIPASEWLTFTIPGEPVSKARARFSKGRTYTPAKTAEAERVVASAFVAAGGRFEPDKEVTFEVDVTFHNGTRQRRDVDNMLKLILDGLNKVAWVDDTQVMEIAGRKRFVDRADARTEVAVRPVGRMSRITRRCRQCGEEFITYPSQAASTRFCSADCRATEKVAARRRTCAHCGESFQAANRGEVRIYCSTGCRDAHGKADVDCAACGTRFRTHRSWVGDRNYCSDDCRRVRDAEIHRERRTKKFPGTCAICGSGTTRKEYVRCNPCKLAGKTAS